MKAHRRHELTITIKADERHDIAYAIKEIAKSICEAITAGTGNLSRWSAGGDATWILEHKEDPEMTRGRYLKEVKQELAVEDAAKSEGAE